MSALQRGALEQPDISILSNQILAEVTGLCDARVRRCETEAIRHQRHFRPIAVAETLFRVLEGVSQKCLYNGSGPTKYTFFFVAVIEMWRSWEIPCTLIKALRKSY